MDLDFVAWDFGDSSLLSGEYPEYNKITQQLIKEVMPLNYKPYGLREEAKFDVIKDYIVWLINYNELEQGKRWLAELIRYKLLPDHDADFDILISEKPFSISIKNQIDEEKFRLESLQSIQEITTRLQNMKAREHGTSWKELMNATEEIF